jgi:hypothetical protein
MGTTTQNGCAALVNCRGAALCWRSRGQCSCRQQALTPYFHFMNILIENEETLEYLTNENNWSKNPLKGKKFVNSQLAFRAAKLEAIGKFNVVCYIPQTEQFINLDHGRGTEKTVKAEVT